VTDPSPPQRVEIVVTVRTLLLFLTFGLLVVLAILSLGTLLSIFLAAVIALCVGAGSAVPPRSPSLRRCSSPSSCS
jgi:hypothetical protein